MADWAAVLNTTIPLYLKEFEDQTMRNRKLLAMLKAKNRVKYNQSGTKMNWRVEYKENHISPIGDMSGLNFARQNRHKTAELDWRGYAMPEAVSWTDQLKNAGPQAIISIMGTTVENMLKNFEADFSEQLYIDGNATGNELKVHGIESFTGVGANVITSTPAFLTDDSYAGLDTDLAGYGGQWFTSPGTAAATPTTSLWPTGSGTSEYDFWSPLLVSTTNNAFWTSAADTWAEGATSHLRYGILHSRRNKGKSGQIDMVLTNQEMYRQFTELLAAKERILVTQGQNNGAGTSLTALGFGDITRFEGCEVTSEFGVPASTAYGFTINEMELDVMTDKLFMMRGPIFNEEDLSTRFVATFNGNLRFLNIRNFVKWYPYG